jgi:hypothetical protein
MGLLAPIGKLVNHLTEDLVLRIQKSNEVRIGHPRSVVQAMTVLECDRLAITAALPHLRHLSLLTVLADHDFTREFGALFQPDRCAPIFAIYHTKSPNARDYF